MGNDHILSEEEMAEVVSTLAAAATRQRYACDDLLDQLKRAVSALNQGTSELTRDMPNKIAQRAAEKVVQGIADLVTQKVANALQPTDAKAQTFLRKMEEAVEECRRAAAEYRRAARNAIWTCIIAFAVLVLAALVLPAVKWAGIV